MYEATISTTDRASLDILLALWGVTGLWDKLIIIRRAEINPDNIPVCGLEIWATDCGIGEGKTLLRALEEVSGNAFSSLQPDIEYKIVSIEPIKLARSSED